MINRVNVILVVQQQPAKWTLWQAKIGRSLANMSKNFCINLTKDGSSFDDDQR